ncbi:MAG: hypothetical protein KDK65_01745 [Chlamydiia bacterium]|nr:hypothetical protein [Chlamydiia bacterium]
MAVGTADKGLLKTVGEGFREAVDAAAYPGGSSRVLKDVLRVVSTTGRFFVFLTDSTIASVLKINETCGNALKIFTLVELVESVKQWTCDNPIKKGWKSATSSACKGVSRVIKVINLGDSWKFYDLGWLNNPLCKNVKVEGLLTWNRLPIAIFDLGSAVFGFASELETCAKIDKSQKRMKDKRNELMKRACEMTFKKEGKNRTYKVENFKLNGFQDIAMKKVEEKQNNRVQFLSVIVASVATAKLKEGQGEHQKTFTQARDEVQQLAKRELLLPSDWKQMQKALETMEKYMDGKFRFGIEAHLKGVKLCQEEPSKMLNRIVSELEKVKLKENLATDQEAAFNRAKSEIQRMAKCEKPDWDVLKKQLVIIEQHTKQNLNLIAKSLESGEGENAVVFKALQTEYAKQVRLLNKWVVLAASDKGDEVQKFLVEKVKRKDEQILRTERAKLQSDLMRMIYGAIGVMQIVSLFASSNLLAIDPTGQTTLSLLHFSCQMLCCVTALAKDYLEKYCPDKASEVAHVTVDNYTKTKQDETLVMELVEMLFQKESVNEDMANAMAKTYQEQAHHKKPAKESERDFIKRMAKQLAGDIKTKTQTAGYNAEEVAKKAWETIQV